MIHLPVLHQLKNPLVLGLRSGAAVLSQTRAVAWPWVGAVASVLGCGAKLLGSFCTAEMGPSSGGAEFLRDSKHPGEWQML